MFDPRFDPNILIIQGPGIPTTQRQAYGLTVKLEAYSTPLITLIGRLSNRRSILQMPPDEQDLTFTAARIGRQVTIQMCGERIKGIIAQLNGVEDFAQVGEAVKGLLAHCSEHMVATSP